MSCFLSRVRSSAICLWSRCELRNWSMFTPNMNLYHLPKFSPYFPFTLYCFYTKISSFMPVLTIWVVLDVCICFFLFWEILNMSLTFAVNVNLNLVLYTAMVRKCSKEKNCCLYFCLARSNGSHKYIKNRCVVTTVCMSVDQSTGKCKS